MPKKAKKTTRTKLNETFTELYKRYKRLQKKAAAARKAQDESTAARDAIVAAMGDADQAELTDGRVIAKDPQKRHWPPLPAKVVRWVGLKDVTEELA